MESRNSAVSLGLAGASALTLTEGRAYRNCQGLGRRSALQLGLLSAAGLTMGDWLRAKAVAAQSGTAGRSTSARAQSVILVWLDGGPSQLESYDPKPHAPQEYRGPYAPISTSIPGMQLSSLLPAQARVADKLAVIRSLHHGTGDHFAAAHWMLTGRFGATTPDPAPKYPSVGAYVSKVLGARQAGMPAYVGLPAAESVFLFPGYQGAAYLGNAYNPFDVDRESSYLHHSYATKVGRPKCLDNLTTPEHSRTIERQSLLSALDRLERRLDATRQMETLDQYQQAAMSMILSGRARQAFDLEKEDPRLIDKYGDNPWGRYTLMARRAVEAGVTFVTVDMPHWDHHAELERHAQNFQVMDRAVGALIEDLADRGLLDETLVVVMGEFGRTPRINNGQPGIPIPGRDHWGDAISAMIAGGGVRGGQVVGATNTKAEFPTDRPLKPHDLLATIYHQLGMDVHQSFQDHAGRPVPILAEGEPIRELV